MEITTWAQQDFQKSLSVSTAHRAIYECRLELGHAKRTPNINMMQEHFCLCWAKVKNSFVVRWIKIFFCKHGCVPSSRLERVGIIQVFSSTQFIILYLWSVCISSYGSVRSHILEGQHNLMFSYVLLKRGTILLICVVIINKLMLNICNISKICSHTFPKMLKHMIKKINIFKLNYLELNSHFQETLFIFYFATEHDPFLSLKVTQTIMFRDFCV